jgi:lipopolysaccharide transport system ATP-binding protein
MHAAAEPAPPAPEGAPELLIEVRGLGKRYEIYAQPRDRLLQSLFRGRRQFFQEFWALADISFEVRRGETVGIVGRNGSGKSTLLQLIAGTLTPTTGTVDVRGRIAALLELGSGFNPEFSGRENVFLNGAILGLARSEIEARLPEIVAFSGLEEFIDRPVKTYSSGMLMRLAFAVAVNVEPDILIIDEALAVGDIAFQLKCIERLERLTRSGVTLLFVSHDTSLVKTFCRHAVYLDRGRLRAQGTPDVVTELYALDIRQAEGAQSGRPVALKPFVGEGDGIAFGTDEGRIVAAAFTSTGSSRASSDYGNDLEFDVDVEFAPDVSQPSMAVIVQDRHAREIGAAWFPLEKPEPEGGRCRSRLRLGFGTRLGAGPYSITLRLESRRSDQLLFPIDKQVSVLVFDVSQPDRAAFRGVVDLGFRCAPVVPAAGATTDSRL